jgi:hypothetical protein
MTVLRYRRCIAAIRHDVGLHGGHPGHHPIVLITSSVRVRTERPVAAAHIVPVPRFPAGAKMLQSESRRGLRPCPFCC